jgi:hypothetical protein
MGFRTGGIKNERKLPGTLLSTSKLSQAAWRCWYSRRTDPEAKCLSSDEIALDAVLAVYKPPGENTVGQLQAIFTGSDLLISHSNLEVTVKNLGRRRCESEEHATVHSPCLPSGMRASMMYRIVGYRHQLLSGSVQTKIVCWGQVYLAMKVIKCPSGTPIPQNTVWLCTHHSAGKIPVIEGVRLIEISAPYVSLDAVWEEEIGGASDPSLMLCLRSLS